MKTLAMLALAACCSMLPAHASGDAIRLTATVMESPQGPNLDCTIGTANDKSGPADGTIDGDHVVGTWSSTECLDLASEPGVITIRDGRFTIPIGTSAILGTYSAHAGLPSAEGHLYASGTFTITGGIGAYAGASGSGLVTGVGNLTTGIGTLDLAGTISIP